MNRLPGRVRGGLAETRDRRPAGRRRRPEGAPVEVLVRPEGLRLGAGEGAPQAEVEACRLLGATTLVHLAVPDGAGGLLHLHARLPPGRRLARGERVTVALDPERAFVFPPEAP